MNKKSKDFSNLAVPFCQMIRLELGLTNIHTLAIRKDLETELKYVKISKVKRDRILDLLQQLDSLL